MLPYFETFEISHVLILLYKFYFKNRYNCFIYTVKLVKFNLAYYFYLFIDNFN